MYRNTRMYFYVRIQDVSSTFSEIQGCISMYLLYIKTIDYIYLVKTIYRQILVCIKRHSKNQINITSDF